METTATHAPGDCWVCDRLRAALAHLHTETVARTAEHACIAIRQRILETSNR